MVPTITESAFGRMAAKLDRFAARADEKNAAAYAKESDTTKDHVLGGEHPTVPGFVEMEEEFRLLTLQARGGVCVSVCW